MEIRPLGNLVLVKRREVHERETASGLVIPERSAPATYYNDVKAVGPDVYKIRVGDTVLTTQFVGDEVRQNQESFYLVGEVDVLAIIDEDGGPNGTADDGSNERSREVA